MAYFDTDGLLRKYGTEKAVPTNGGDFRQPGANRVLELTVDLTKLTAGNNTIINDVTFFGTSMFIEQVDLIADVAASGGTSVNFGLMALDRTTVLSATAFVNGAATATMTPAGKKQILTQGSTGAGTYIGGTSAAPGYITAQATGTFTAGSIKLRIHYRGIGNITQ